MIAILLVLQAGAALSPPQTIDLLAATPERCVPVGDEVIVCARREDRRLDPTAPPVGATAGPPDGPLSFRLPGGGTGRVHAIQSEIGGAKGQGAEVTVRLPF